MTRRLEVTLALKEVLLLSSIISLCVPAYAEVLITNNPYNQISYTQDIENIYFSIEILDSTLIKGRYPIIDFASISVDKNKNKKIDEYLDTSYGVGNLKICGQYLINERASSTCEKLSTQATLKVYVGKTQYSQKEHSIFEFKIPKSELSFDEASAEVTFQVYSAKSKYKNYPQINDGLFTSTISIPFKKISDHNKTNSTTHLHTEKFVGLPYNSATSVSSDMKNIKADKALTPKEKKIEAKRQENLSKQREWENKINYLPVIDFDKKNAREIAFKNQKDFDPVKDKAEEECRSWKNSYILEPTPEKNKYIQENCH